MACADSEHLRLPLWRLDAYCLRTPADLREPIDFLEDSYGYVYVRPTDFKNIVATVPEVDIRDLSIRPSDD